MKSSDNKNNTIQRRRVILQKLMENGEVYVNELSQSFKVSEVTIRNDLLQLEQKNLLLRVRGGAIKLEVNSELDKNYSEKARLHFQEKTHIGKSAAKLLEEHDTVIIGPGTTTTEMARNLPKDIELTVITNALPVLHNLISYQNLNLIVLGGRVGKRTGTLYGPIAEMGLKKFFADKVFLGADGCDINRGLFTSDLESAQIIQMMITNARQIILLVDSSKFTRKGMALVCPFEKVDIVVTDDGLSREDRHWLKEHEISLIIA